MSRVNANIPVAFANAPAPPGSEPTVNLDTDLNYVLGLIQDSANGFVNSSTDVGTANAYAVNLNATIAPSGYANGMTVAFLIANANTGASTLNVNSLGTVPILTVTGSAVTANTLVAGNIAFCVYYAGNFYLTSVPFTTLNQDLGSLATNSATVNCAGFNQVNVALTYTGAGVFTLTLNNVGLGTIITWVGKNNTGGARTFLLNATYGPTAINITPIIAYGYYNAGSGYSQRIVMDSGTTNLIAYPFTFVFQATVQTLATTPILYGTIAAGGS